MRSPTKTQAIYSQIKMLEPTLRFIKDNLEQSESGDLEIFAELSMACVHLKSVLVKIEHTFLRNI